MERNPPHIYACARSAGFKKNRNVIRVWLCAKRPLRFNAHLYLNVSPLCGVESSWSDRRRLRKRTVQENVIIEEEETSFEIIPYLEEGDFSEINLDEDSFSRININDLTESNLVRNEFPTNTEADNRGGGSNCLEINNINKCQLHRFSDTSLYENVTLSSNGCMPVEVGSSNKDLPSNLPESLSTKQPSQLENREIQNSSSYVLQHDTVSTIRDFSQEVLFPYDHKQIILLSNLYQEKDSTVAERSDCYDDCLDHKYLETEPEKIIELLPIKQENDKCSRLKNDLSGFKRQENKATICDSVKASMNECKWLQKCNFLRSAVEKAKISVNMLCAAVEKGLDQIFGNGNLLQLTVVSKESHSYAVERAFLDTFDCDVSLSIIDITMDSIPELPVGFEGGLRAAKAKLDHVLKRGLVSSEDLLVSTSNFIFEPVPLGWQISTILYLFDQKRKFHLFNFTVTTPVPNEYVASAELLTPLNYPLKEQGFGVDLENVISTTQQVRSKTTSETLDEYNNYKAIKAAGFILAGMYKTYLDGFE